ncbi:phage holin [Romboutsia sp. 1001713B170207_170306_H8]|uniref:phage holin n=1 Tax=Romboutsia sp. 1001713B170207_170306_H8 TaxID=2787112 RepID=UPI0008207B3D|nr:phage holin [Romboutsia sp. 1001713B170207_170306_H8]SCI09184.1 Small integral membrane protein [uncultured Clostridium sp.]
MKINWKVRFKNPLFVAQLWMSVLVPILAYAGLTVQDLTTWKALGDLLLGAFSNPYVLGLVVISVYNAILDPTTKGINDSLNVLNKEVK